MSLFLQSAAKKMLSAFSTLENNTVYYNLPSDTGTVMASIFIEFIFKMNENTSILH